MGIRCLPLFPTFKRVKLAKSGAGFTLVELLIVIAVIGVLATGVVALLNPLEQIQRVNDAKRKSDLSQIQKALEAYYQDNGRYPTSSANYQITNPDDGLPVAWGTAWSSTEGTSYMGTLPKDPEFPAKTYAYKSDNNEQTYYLYASLDRATSDPQACNEGDPCTTAPETACGAGTTCTFGASSPDVIVSLHITPTPTPLPTSTPTPQPPQTPVKTNYPSGAFSYWSVGNITAGYRFKANVNGKITALWDYSYGGTKTLKLWSDTGTLLNSVVVIGNRAWVQGTLTTSTNVAAGIYYRVSTYLTAGAGGYFFQPTVLPVTHGDIVIDSMHADAGDVFPTGNMGQGIFGIADISFVTD